MTILALRVVSADGLDCGDAGRPCAEDQIGCVVHFNVFQDGGQ